MLIGSWGAKPTPVFDTTNAAEMARLIRQSRVVLKHMGGVLPECTDLSSLQTILDLACGTGDWALELARLSPLSQVTGVDLNTMMVEYARSVALEQGLHNVHFLEMDILQALDFPDKSFDLVNANLIFTVMNSTTWPLLLRECQRIVRPGGMIRLTEAELGFTTSPALEKLLGLYSRALFLAGKSFSPDGRHSGVLAVLARLLRDLGCVNVQKRSYIIEYSADTPDYVDMFQIYQAVFKLVQPFLITSGVTTQQEVETLYLKAMEEIQSAAFCGVGIYMTTWGTIPR